MFLNSEFKQANTTRVLKYETKLWVYKQANITIDQGPYMKHDQGS